MGAVLILLGVLQIIGFIINVSYNIESKFSESKKYEMLEEKHEEYAKKAYSLGRTWGKINAEYVEANKEDFDMTLNYGQLANFAIENRVADSHCWGAEDCGDLPTNEDLMKWYYIDKRTGNMPVYSFVAGFENAFIEYMELYEIH